MSLIGSATSFGGSPRLMISYPLTLYKNIASGRSHQRERLGVGHSATLKRQGPTKTRKKGRLLLRET